MMPALLAALLLTCTQPPDGEQCVAMPQSELAILLTVEVDLSQCESDRTAELDEHKALQLELAELTVAAQRRADKLDELLGQATAPLAVSWYERPWFVATVSVVATVAVVYVVR